jgi:uncharacterized C2H2 Zn-finger protein
MIKHLHKKKICERSLSCSHNDEEILNLSLIRIKDNDNDDIKCNVCNKVFSTKNSLLRHNEKRTNFLLNHEGRNPCKSSSEITNLFEDSNKIECSEEKLTQNITNYINNNHINNTTNIINLNINILRSFDEEWDDSKIDDKSKIILLLEDSKYTKTLENILENDINLNVLIDSDSDTGLIYKKNTFEIMDIKDIVEKSMEKIYNQLNKFHREIEANNEYNIKKDYLDEEKKNIEDKYINYKLNNDTKDKVINFIKNIYNKKKDETLKICNDIIDKNIESGF